MLEKDEWLKFFQVHFPMLLAVAFTSPKGSKFLDYIKYLN
jgi:hypothetical protein